MRTLPSLTFVAGIAVSLQSQATPTSHLPCRGAPCSLIVDWGVGKTAADMPPDRKYGSPDVSSADESVRRLWCGDDHEAIRNVCRRDGVVLAQGRATEGRQTDGQVLMYKPIHQGDFT